MKQSLYLLIAVILMPVLLGAQAAKDWQRNDLGYLDLPSASIDNLFIPLVNPALLATGHASGIGYAQLVDDMKFRDNHWVFANLDGLAYNLEYYKDPLTGRSSNFHTIAMGTQMPRNILPNLYLGANYRWKNSSFSGGGFRTALAYRPHASTALAFSWDNPHGEKPSYHAGLAIRPLSFVKSIPDHRLELSADIDYSKTTSADYEVHNPVLGINTRVYDGLTLGATYNLDTETVFANFSLSLGKTELGTLAHAKEQDNYFIPYIHLTDDTFKPFLGLSGDNWYSMKLQGELKTFAGPQYSFGPLQIYGDEKSIEDVISELKKAKEDPRVSGILLKNPSFSTSLALSQELVTALQDFKCGGKQVAFYYDNISNGGYILAGSVADKIYLNPMGSVDLRGLSISSPYLRELLDSVGVDVINFRSHKYKNAGNMFSETEMTEAEREVYESLLQSLFDQIVASLNAGRGEKLASGVEDIIDAGPYYLAQDALTSGLVDGLIYDDQLQDTLKNDFSFSASVSELPDYRDYEWALPRQSLIAVIYAQGNIIMGKATPGQAIAHETTVDLIRAARKNPEYKGIILRVDSGGGSAQASDAILRELELARTENKKPVVVSMSGVAASGGYYISCGADRIIADPATLTGSIGVIGLNFNLPRMWDKLKVNWSTVKKGANADFGSTSRYWTEDEKNRMSSLIEYVYEDFVRKVDGGRDNLNYDEVHAIAQGRVWTGEQAMANGLVDDLGGLDTAVEHMRQITGIEGEITLVDATSKREGFSIQLDSDALGSIPQLQILNSLSEDYIQAYELWRDFADDPVLMLSPVGAENVIY